MKKISFLTLFLAVVVLLCSCTVLFPQSSSSSKPDDEFEEQATEPRETSSGSGEQQESKPDETNEETVTFPTLDVDDEKVMFVRDEIAVTQNDPTQFYIPHQVNQVECVDKFTDGTYNYYYYYLGYLENFPLMYSSTINHTGTNQEYERTLSAESQKSIEDSVSKSVSVTNSSYFDCEAGKEIGIEATVKNMLTASCKRTFKISWGSEHSQTTATENTHSVAESWAESSSDSFKLNLSSTDPLGKYRYVHYTKKCFVYAVVVYDISNDEFLSYDYLTFADESIKNSVVMIEYVEKDGTFASDNESNLIFDTSVINTINRFETLENRVPSIVPTVCQPIDVPVNKHLCKKDSGYDSDTNGDSNHGKAHDGFEIGHLTIFGCEEMSIPNTYTIKKPEEFAIQYVFDEDPYKLPNPINSTYEYKVYDDTATNVLDVELEGKVGMGVYSVRIYRKNGIVEQPTVVSNFMSSKTKKSVADIIKEVEDPETISKVEIVIVYELRQYVGWNFGDAGSYRYTNWRSDYTFNFQ